MSIRIQLKTSFKTIHQTIISDYTIYKSCELKQQKKVRNAKLRNNTTFGKSIQSLMKEVDVKLWPAEKNT